MNKPATNKKRNVKCEKWKIMYANVRGMKSKMTCVKDVLSEIKPDIALFTETHLTENKGVNVKGYTFFGEHRKKQKGGGVGILVLDERKISVAPHYSTRELEIVWVSISRNGSDPLFIGVYYGKQETTCNKQAIKLEMDTLSEEIQEMISNGEVILCMDANAKFGLMGEEISRNGKLMKSVFDECQVEIINSSDKCEGQITRQNRKKPDEKSAIDIVVATYSASQWITKMFIDEDGDYRMKNISESDHNTILVDLQVAGVVKNVQQKRTVWNIRASAEKWAQFRLKLGESIDDAKIIMNETAMSISERYRKWEKMLYKIAISTIGKTTQKV